MHWNTRLQRVIDYIEEHLREDIEIGELTSIACTSRYHFHRVFHATFKVTPAQYIRQRRLSMAGAALMSQQYSVTDIAFEYGYVSVNAFTRAFRQLHGVNPGRVSIGLERVKVYPRATISDCQKGDVMLQYRLIHKPAWQILGISKHWEFEQFSKEGGAFWKDYVATNEYQSLLKVNDGLSGAITGASLMSVYFPDEGDSRNTFIDVLAVEQPDKLQTENAEFERFVVPAATWAEFTCTYSTSMKTNRAIYRDWFNASGYERDGDKPDVACYFPLPFRPMKDMLIRWWIPVVPMV